MGIVLPKIESISPEIDKDSFDFQQFKALIQPNPGPFSGFVAFNPKGLELPKSAFIVYAHLLKYRSRDTGRAFLRGSSVGITERQISRIFDQLQTLGLVRRVGPATCHIPIHDTRGRLYPCFNRTFWDNIQGTLYLNFRIAVVLGVFKHPLTGLNVREVRDGLRCRFTMASDILRTIKENNLCLNSVVLSVRLQERGRGDTPNHTSNKSPIKDKTPSEIPVSLEAPIPTCQERIIKENVSAVSTLSSDKEKEILTRSERAFLHIGNFKNFGLPNYPISVQEIGDFVEPIREYEDILSAAEVQFLKILFTHVRKQAHFAAYPISLFVSQAVNLFISLKLRGNRLKLQRSILDYFCGSLLALLATNPPVHEINQLKNRAKERQEIEKDRIRKEELNRKGREEESQEMEMIFDFMRRTITGYDTASNETLIPILTAKMTHDDAFKSAIKALYPRLYETPK